VPTSMSAGSSKRGSTGASSGAFIHDYILVGLFQAKPVDSEDGIHKVCSFTADVTSIFVARVTREQILLTLLIGRNLRSGTKVKSHRCARRNGPPGGLGGSMAADARARGSDMGSAQRMRGGRSVGAVVARFQPSRRASTPALRTLSGT